MFSNMQNLDVLVLGMRRKARVSRTDVEGGTAQIPFLSVLVLGFFFYDFGIFLRQLS